MDLEYDPPDSADAWSGSLEMKERNPMTSPTALKRRSMEEV